MKNEVIGPFDVHDARVVNVAREHGESGRCVVTLDPQNCRGGQLEFAFDGVEEIVSTNPIGMILYSIIKMAHDPQQFVFVNWDEEDSKQLSIKAQRCQWKRVGESSWESV